MKRYIDELREVSERDDPYTLRVEDNELRSATVVKNLEWKMHALKEQHRLELDQMRQVINEEKAKSREKEGVWEKRVAKLLRVCKLQIYRTCFTLCLSSLFTVFTYIYVSIRIC